MIVVSRLSTSSHRASIRLAGAAVSALACVISGCNPLGVHMSEQRLVGSGEYDVIKGLVVPETAGAAGCGAQALACLMHYADPSCDAKAACDRLPFHQSGANAIHILLAARAHGFQAGVSRGTWNVLSDFVARRQPVMVMFDRNIRGPTLIPPPEILHWGVVSGMSRDRKRLLCAAPGSRHYVIDRGLFLDCWEASDYCTIEVTKRPSDENE